MRNTRLTLIIVAIAALSPASVGAQGSPMVPAAYGQAWDSVTKIVPDGDAWSLRPGHFDSDFAIASNEQLQVLGSGSVLGYTLNQLTAMGNNMSKLMQNGFAEKYYATDYKARIDQPAFHRATIVDCAAQTITTLDLRAKTFDVERMEHYGSPLGDNLHLTLNLVNSTWGKKQFAGEAADDYRSVVAITETKPNGDRTRSAVHVGYYTDYADFELACPTKNYVSDASHGDGFPALRNLTMIMNQFHQILADFAPGYSVTVAQTGPQLPDEFAMYEAISPSNPQGTVKGAFIVERGNMHRVANNDPVFSVPPDFKLQATGAAESHGGGHLRAER